MAADHTASRYEVTAFIGPCSEEEADEMATVVAGAVEGRHGAVVGWRRLTDEEREHELKCWPPFFQAILDGDKTFEVRKNDRGFQKGDSLILREYDPTPSIVYPQGRYTGRDFPMIVGYVLSGFPGIEDGYVVMGLRDA